ncbi:zinc-dependent metalloprotease [Paradesertivirga mongoliensis]|uniref:Zinc-dependent metalloprotease n=1 Tax=Paradesertivirga mongoliensis TaxID=2100740 RepID=A0ABW4ZKK0_9SPHI|nr:zinc-dependent metalloprotease [Pedobacter mongoliensis]
MQKLLLAGLLLIGTLAGVDANAQKKNKGKKNANIAAKPTSPEPPKEKKPTLAEKVKSSKKLKGLFTIYQDTITGSVQLYVKKNQLGKEFVYQSFSISGPTSLYLNQSMHRATSVFKIVKAFDKLEFQEVNTNFYYDKANAVSKTAGVDVPEAVVLSEKYTVEDSVGYLVNADALFISDKLDPVKPLAPIGAPPTAFFNLGSFNSAKSKYHKVKSFPDNIDVQVDLAYDNPAPYNGGGNDITDARYIRVRMQHSFIEVPQNNFQPRLDDPRIGYFTQEINNLTSIDPVNYRDMINRWHLVKKDPNAALSEPVEPIVWWIENTTPVEFRQTVKEAGEKWNEAFEKAGFKNAVVMKIMPDTVDWDPSDIRYNVIRWVSSAHPQYGAIGPSFVNPRTGQILGSDITVEWYSGSATPIMDELYRSPAPQPLVFPGMKHQEITCTMAHELKAQYSAGLTALQASQATDADIKEMHKQFLYYLILHEMGHTLGLNHNMKSSQMLKLSEVHNTAITRKKGLTGSVMDYPAINISVDRRKQGDYYTTRPGPYDIWAIQFGYTPVSAAEEDMFRKKLLSRSTEPDLAFGNDADDMRSPGKAIDPRVNVNDMSSDAIGYAVERLTLVNNIIPNLKDKYSKEGRGYAELRARYNSLLGQRSSMINVVSRYVGGVYVDRSFVGQNSPNKPFTPVPLATQKRAMQVLTNKVFAPDAFKADNYLLPYLQSQRRGFNFFSGTEDPKLSSMYNNLGTSALAHILHPTTTQRITDSRMYGNQYSLADVMNDLSKGIFDADLRGNVNTYRQYLQTAFVKQLSQLADVKSPTDDVSKAASRYTLKKLKTKMSGAVAGNEETKAHRNNLVYLINQALVVK